MELETLNKANEIREKLDKVNDALDKVEESLYRYENEDLIELRMRFQNEKDGVLIPISQNLILAMRSQLNASRNELMLELKAL